MIGAALGVVLDRHVEVQRVSADDDAGGVDALAARHALDGARSVDDALGVGIGAVLGA